MKKKAFTITELMVVIFIIAILIAIIAPAIQLKINNAEIRDTIVVTIDN
ncbi:hypothetical protein LCGC14_3160980, partial [marine sediment metagenome]